MTSIIFGFHVNRGKGKIHSTMPYQPSNRQCSPSLSEIDTTIRNGVPSESTRVNRERWSILDKVALLQLFSVLQSFLVHVVRKFRPMNAFTDLIRTADRCRASQKLKIPCSFRCWRVRLPALRVGRVLLPIDHFEQKIIQ